MTGVITSAPARSPSHQVSQIEPKFGRSAQPASVRLPTPIVALNAVGKKLMNEKRATPAGFVKVSRPPDQRLTSQAPVSPSSMLPAPIAADVASEPAVVALAAKAAIRIAGAIRYPRSSTAANASPVAGQIGVALGLIEASAKPALARTK